MRTGWVMMPCACVWGGGWGGWGREQTVRGARGSRGREERRWVGQRAKAAARWWCLDETKKGTPWRGAGPSSALKCHTGTLKIAIQPPRMRSGSRRAVGTRRGRNFLAELACPPWTVRAWENGSFPPRRTHAPPTSRPPILFTHPGLSLSISPSDPLHGTASWLGDAGGRARERRRAIEPESSGCGHPLSLCFSPQTHHVRQDRAERADHDHFHNGQEGLVFAGVRGVRRGRGALVGGGESKAW